MTTKRVVWSILGIIAAADLIVVLLIFAGAILMTHFGSEIVELYLP